MILSLGNLNSKILIADITCSSSSTENAIDICNRKKAPNMPNKLLLTNWFKISATFH